VKHALGEIDGLTVQDVASGKILKVEGERLVSLGATTNQEPVAFVSPGWIDLQVNGFAGYDMNSSKIQPEDVLGLVLELRAEGVTHLLPTVITNSAEHIEHCLETIARAHRIYPDVQRAVPAIHLEGPYISAQDGARGAHALVHIRPPDLHEFTRFQAAANNLIRLVTLAPEVPGALPFIRRLSGLGIRVAIGHSLASTNDIDAAVVAGARLSTHLGNGLPAMLPRHANPVWDQLANDSLYASMIFDGHHLPSNVMRVFLRAKGISRCVLVSDSVALARLTPGVYQSEVGGDVELKADGHVNVAGTEYLAGSASSLRDCLEVTLSTTSCSLRQAVRMVTNNPRRLMGLRCSSKRTVFRCDDEGRISVLGVVSRQELR
jgi:N-acetylglucosamine-6-phosphate deacetylase